ncbi:hypothetical protein [Sporomusa sp. KB1]|jgi:hypothetical protein|uniref:hypothetical protein n=1 Tax=Sporomusa sp. KB1 TaxID=943346 RepID=UPI0011A41393|nr:hypothetical protein [Sporomusa sp. KB1]TWH46451.1 hypothetical protein Salpa_2442 [Sporomusa sp. KB1]
MERKTTSIPPVERLGKISPVRPIQFFNQLSDQSMPRKKNKLKNQQVAKEHEKRPSPTEGSIDLKA